MAISDQLKQLVDQMPAADSRGMYTTDIDKEKIEKAAAEIAKGGKANLLGLIEMLGSPGAEEDVKPHYALHCVVNYTLVAADEKLRKDFCDAMAEQLGNEKLTTYNRGYLCQELQWAGRGEATAALAKLLTDEDLVEPASMALVAIRQGATEQLLAALPKTQGKCRLNVVHSLAALGEKPAVGALQEAMADPDREVRLAAGSGLARAGDAGSVDLLLKAAGAEPGWQRVQATKHCLVLAEKLSAGGNKEAARKIYASLRDSRTDPSEKYVRDQAEKALAAM